FIELAGEINTAMPRYVVGRLEEALDRHSGISLGRARILMIGLAYKKNVSDIRESPSFKLMELIEKRGGRCDYHDPHVGEIPATREHAEFKGRLSAVLSSATVAAYDAILISTDHDAVDYALLAADARLIIDTRNVFAKMGLTNERVVKA
ncbi:MAG: UDP binding domain-containing protein, partial [Hyphomicrobiaceae bacterium]